VHCYKLLLLYSKQLICFHPNISRCSQPQYNIWDPFGNLYGKAFRIDFYSMTKRKKRPGQQDLLRDKQLTYSAWSQHSSSILGIFHLGNFAWSQHCSSICWLISGCGDPKIATRYYSDCYAQKYRIRPSQVRRTQIWAEIHPSQPTITESVRPYRIRCSWSCPKIFYLFIYK